MHCTHEKMTEKHGRIASFYEGKCIFMTGAAGFLGLVLLETLLRCCPRIQCIYILLREKKGVLPQKRKETIFEKSIFSYLKKTHPDTINKVHVIPGDSSLPDLGMSHEDLLKVTQNVSIVFHLAASISFLKPVRFILTQNVCGVDHVITLCKKLKKMDALVYTSTAFSNSNREGTIEEEIYRLPFKAQRFLDAIKNGSDDEINDLISRCFPKWPNTYSFSKCLAENLILEKASEIPTAILRPSVVANCWKGISPGYVEEGSGLVDLSTAIAKGFVRVLPVSTGTKLDVIPVDVVVNSHVIAAYKVQSQRLSPMVVNCTSGDMVTTTLRSMTDILLKLTAKHPVPKGFLIPKVSYQKNFILFWLVSVYEHYLPAYVIDMILHITGRKPRLVQLYRFFDMVMENLYVFLNGHWNFDTHNFKSLGELHPEDKEMFYTDLTDLTIEALTEPLPMGAPAYQWNVDKKTIPERQRIVQMRTMLATSIKYSALACLFSLLYVIVKIVISL